MGLRNASPTFQSLMNQTFRDCIDEYVVVYMDDLLILSESEEDHLKHLKTILSRLPQNEMYVSYDKFSFFSTEVELFGMIVNQKRISVGQDRKEIIRSWPKPKTLTDLLGFIGHPIFPKIHKTIFKNRSTAQKCNSLRVRNYEMEPGM